MQPLTLRLMGPVELIGPGNRRLTPRGMRARGALAVLGSATSMRVLRARLQDLLFSTRDPDHANASLRQVTKTRRSFPSDDAVLKLLYLALHQIAKKWTMPLRDWKPAMTQFMIMYGDRVSL